MKKRTLLAMCGCALIGALFTTGCEGGGDSGSGGPSTGVAGTWNGTAVVTAGAGAGTKAPTVFKLSQSGSSVSGTWDGFRVSGLVSGNHVTLNLTPFSRGGVAFTGNCSGNVSGDSFSWTASVTGVGGGQTETAKVKGQVSRNGAQTAVEKGDPVETLLNILTQ